MKNRERILKTVLSALFLALALVMPYLTGQIPEVGSMLCPMHLPILLLGILCGPLWGLAVGLTAPLLRSVLLGMPPLFPMAVSMSLELAAYGATSGLLRRLLPKKRFFLYPSLLAAMLVGRLVFGVAMLFCMTCQGMGYPLSAFLAGTVTGSIPGILLQILLVPPLVMLVERKGGFPNS